MARWTRIPAELGLTRMERAACCGQAILSYNLDRPGSQKRAEHAIPSVGKLRSQSEICACDLAHAWRTRNFELRIRLGSPTGRARLKLKEPAAESPYEVVVTWR